jgi:hypothetical protein
MTVTATIGITTILFFYLVRYRWGDRDGRSSPAPPPSASSTCCSSPPT